jgi:hypothetical protein
MSASCTPSITADFNSQTSLDSWKTRITSRLNQIGAYNTYTIDDMNEVVYTIAVDVNNHYNCINSKGLRSVTLATDLAHLQTQNSSLDSTIEERIHDVKISHDRAAMARNPEMTRGYYDGWFPISRPLKHYTIPLLIAISIFLFALAFFYFLSLFGLDVRFLVPIPKIITGPIESYGAPSLYKSKPFLIMAGVAGALFILTIVGFTKKSA